MEILQYWWQLLLIGAGIYLVSNTNFAIIFSKGIAHKDIRQCGSGNPGTTNVVRNFGIKLGSLTFVCDMCKGILAACVGLWVLPLFISDAAVVLFGCYFFGFCAVLGHIFPIFIKFHGDKGIATSLGFFLFIHPVYTAVTLLIALAIIILTDKVSIFALFHISGQLIYTIIRCVLSELTTPVTIASISAVLVMWGVIVFSHRTNIKRLLTGKENPSGIRKVFIKPKKDKSE